MYQLKFNYVIMHENDGAKAPGYQASYSPRAEARGNKWGRIKPLPTPG